MVTHIIEKRGDYFKVRAGENFNYTGSFISDQDLEIGFCTNGSNLISLIDHPIPGGLTNQQYIHTQSGLSSEYIGSFVADNNAKCITSSGKDLLSSRYNSFIYTHSGVSDTLIGSFDLGQTINGMVVINGSLIVSTNVGVSSNDYIYTYSGISSTLTGSFYTGIDGAPVGNIASSGNNLLTPSVLSVTQYNGVGSEVFSQYDGNENALQLFDIASIDLADKYEVKFKTKFDIEGVEYDDVLSSQVKISNNEYNSISNFKINLDNTFGKYASTFTVGDTVEIYADETVEALTNKIFLGTIEKIRMKGSNGLNYEIELSGRDNMIILLDSTVSPIVYNGEEVSDIVKDLISNNTIGITTNNVAVTSTNISRITFNHPTVFEAIRQLAELSGYFFYIDTDSDLHFEKRNNVSSSVVLSESIAFEAGNIGNIRKSLSNQTKEGMFNSVYVYGDRMLAGFEESFVAGSPIGGSEFSLLSKPRNTFVEASGISQKGGVFELTSTPESGINYLSSYDEQMITFVSGTSLGYSSIPDSGTSVLVKYDRDIPIVRFGQNKKSVELYGKKEKIINDSSITDPKTATDILKSELDKADPFRGIEVDVIGWYDLTPGTTLKVELAEMGMAEEIAILNTTYNLSKRSIAQGKIIVVSLDKRIIDINDSIATLKNKIRNIEASNMSESDVLTRLEQFDDELQVGGSYWEAATRTQTGSTLYLSDQHLTYNSTLASGTNQKPLAGSGTNIGSPHGPLVIQRFGGFYN